MPPGAVDPRPALAILHPVTVLRATLPVGLAAFWLLASAHCRLERLPGFDFLACGNSPAPSSQPGHDCHDDFCYEVESGHYQIPSHAPLRTDGPAPLRTWAPTDRQSLLSPGELCRSPAVRPPPELAPGWQFAFRAAIPARAPSTLG